MAENKLQHYVPKCHLRQFSSGEAVNLFNIAASRLIRGAPIKGQCARNYFYGRDGKLERALQEIEGAYATVVAKAVDDPAAIDRSDLGILREFALLQTFRTYGYVEKLMALSEKQYTDIEIAAPGKPLPPRMLASAEDAVRMSIGHFLKMREHIEDLELCLIVNQSRRFFVTSDDPAIHTNRYYFQKERSESFGFSNSGAMLFLPLTPELAFVAFDGNVYLAPERRENIITVKLDTEVSAINELQFLHARQNIYYREAAAGEMASAECKRLAGKRPQVWNALLYFEKVGEAETIERYKRVDAMKLERGREYITVIRSVHVQPSRWPELLRYRLRPRVVDTGTAAGVVRPNHPVLKERNGGPPSQRKWPQRATNGAEECAVPRSPSRRKDHSGSF